MYTVEKQLTALILGTLALLAILALFGACDTSSPPEIGELQTDCPVDVDELCLIDNVWQECPAVD
jgi:hypothetical protein